MNDRCFASLTIRERLAPRASLLCLALIAAASLVSDSLAQESAAPFDAPVLVTDEWSKFQALLDLDADGFDDVLDWWWAPAGYLEEVRITGWVNDQAGRMVESWAFDFVVPEGNSGISGGTDVGFVDGDARADFAVAFGEAVWVYTSNGAAAPSLHTNLLHDVRVLDLVLADFDDDGFDDIAYVDDLPEVHIWINQGGIRGFSLSDSFAVPAWGPMSVVESNGDGLPDVMIEHDTQVDLFAIASGQLVTQRTLTHGMGDDKDNMATAGDVDGDGDEDVVVFQAGGRYTLFRRTGSSSYVADPIAMGGPATHLADVDGDGDLDGTCCSGGGGPNPGTTSPNLGESFFHISLNDGSGAFETAFTIEACGGGGIAGVSDLDADGDVDLVAGRVVYYGRGPLTGPPWIQLETEGLLDRHVSDADGDGDPDIEFGVQETLSNAGEGTFTLAGTSVEAPPAGKSWRGPGYPGDFDGDGDVDLIVSLVSGAFSNPTVHEMRLLVNNGAGHLFDGGSASLPDVHFYAHDKASFWRDDPELSVVADADGDGDLDFLERPREGASDTNHVYWNDGSGFFVVGPQLEGAVQAVADLNGDIHPDVVIVSGTDVGFQLGLGGGAFGAATTFLSSRTSIEEDRMDVADLDGDGDIDIVVVDRLTQTLTVHWNDGSALFTTDTSTFAGHLVFDLSNSTNRRVFAVDANDDGWTDLVVSSVDWTWNSSYIFIKKAGLPGFEDMLAQVIWPTTFLDVDGDGDLDAVQGDRDSDLVTDPDRIVFNATHAGSSAGARLQYGVGKPGTGDVTPVLGASGPFRVGEDIAVRLTGLPANSLGLLSVGLGMSELPNTPWPAVTALNWPWIFFVVVPSFGGGQYDGDAFLTMPWTVNASVTIVDTLTIQAYFADGGVSFGRSVTNGLALEFGD